jgi:hypothetical protein
MSEQLPQAMVLVYQPELTHSVWQDLMHHKRTLKGLEAALRKGVRDGEWVAWRLIHIEKEVYGNEQS